MIFYLFYINPISFFSGLIIAIPFSIPALANETKISPSEESNVDISITPTLVTFNTDSNGLRLSGYFSGLKKDKIRTSLPDPSLKT